MLADRVIDTRSEWRTFSNDDQGNDDPSRIGDAANPLLNGSQLHTEVGSLDDGGMRTRELQRAQQKSNLDKTNKSLQAAYSQISALCDAQSFPKGVSDQAKILYKKADEGKIIKGKSQEAIIAGCIFIACRQQGVPRTFREIYRLTNVSKKEIGRTFKLLETFLGKTNRDAGNKVVGNGAVIASDSFEHTKSTTAAEFIERASNRLGLNQQVATIAREAAERINEIGVAAGRSPLSIAGACVFLVSHLMGTPKTPKEISTAVDVSDGTIRTAYKLMYQKLDMIIQPQWIAMGARKDRVPVA